MQRYHLNADCRQHIWRKRPCRAIAAGDDGFNFSAQGRAGAEVGLIAFCHAGHEAIAAAIARNAFVCQYHVAQFVHFIGSEGQRARRPHFYPRPAIFIVARRHHGYGRNIQIELCEIGRRRQRQTDIVNLYTGTYQPVDERELN